MALTFRSAKGAPLTHDELDNNFREFYYSASYSGNMVTLFKSQSNAEPFRLPYPTASGYDTYVQLKSGNNESGSNEFLTSSPNFRFNYSSSILHVTGTYQHLGNINVNGTVTAQRFITTLVTSSIMYTSGSNKFGDTADDTHSFTGHVAINGTQALTGSLSQVGNQSIVGNQNYIGDKIQIGNKTQTGNTTITGSLNVSGSKVEITGSSVEMLVNWPASPGEFHFLQTDPFTVNLDSGNRTYEYAAWALDHHEYGTGVYHNAFKWYMFDSAAKNFGNEFIVGPTLSRMQVFASGSSSTGIITLRDHADGTTRSTVSADYNFIGKENGTVFLQGDVTASNNVLLQQNLTVLGKVTAEEFHTEYISSSIIYKSGSTEFGDSLDDIHTFTGSVNISGSATADYFIGDGSQVLNVISSSYSVSSSYAVTASYVENAVSFPFTGSAGITGSLDVVGPISATSFNATGGVGVPTLTSANNIILSASNHVQIKDALLRVNSLSNAQTASYTPLNGDIFYNTDTNLFVGRKDNQWIAFESQGAGIESILEDTTPQLGGNLDLNTNSISGSGNISITGNIAATGAITATGDITAFYSSDERLKDNVTPISNAIDKVNQIGGYEFDWNDNSEHSGHDVGVIAQEIEKVLPEIVVNRDNGYKAVRYEKIVALLIQAVKEQQLQIDELKSKL